MASEPYIVIGIRNGSIIRAAVCVTKRRAKSLATYLRGYGLEARLLNPADVLKIAPIVEPDSEARLSKSKEKFTKKTKECRVKQQLQAMRSPSRMAQ